MFEEDSLLDEQIKKKKRFVLLVLFALLLVGTLAALSLITPTIPPSQIVAELEKTPTPKQLTSTPFNESTTLPTSTNRAPAGLEISPQLTTMVSVGSKTPDTTAEATNPNDGTPPIDKESSDEVQGDEWQQPEIPTANGVTSTPLQAPTLTATTAESKNGLEESSASSTPDNNALIETRIAGISTSEVTPTAKITLATDTHESNPDTLNRGTPSITVIATKVDEGGNIPKEDTTPTADSDEPNGQPITPAVATESSTSLEENEIPINQLPRVHEIWSPTGEAGMDSTVEASATAPLTPTIGLTHSSTVSETELGTPPNALPVTGVSQRHRSNGAAVVLVILLLGAGIAALHDLGRELE